jgi:hypothetical protein
VLFGGRPLPKLPTWVRVLIFLAFLRAALPLGKFALTQLPAMGFTLKHKMTAEQTVAALARQRGWENASKRTIRCQDHAQTTDWSPERNGAWDYICTFGDPGSPQGMKIGVRVGPDSIVATSSAYPLDAGYVKW